MKTILFSQFLILFILFPLLGKAQYVTVSGYISHFLTDKTIENATIFEKDSGIGTISDEEGYFKLMLLPGEINIMFNEDGFQPLTKQFKVYRDTTLVIKLKPEKWIKNQNKIDLQTKVESKQKESNSQRRFLFF